MSTEARALEHAHDGAVSGWADVGRYVPYRSITLHRFDTDGLPLIIRAKSLRRALRRIAELDAEELGLTDAEAAAILAGDLTPELSDELIQVAAIGRAVYERTLPPRQDYGKVGPSGSRPGHHERTTQ